MKHLFMLTFIIISFVLLSGCENSNNEGSNEKTNLTSTTYDIVNDLDGVTMRVKENTVSSTGLTVILENQSDKECIYGEDFLLEKEIDGKWYQVPIALEDNYGFNDIGYDLASSEIKEWTAEWKWLYGSLGKGKYRIVKDVLDFRGTGDYDKHHLAADFTLE
ncbi:immunoglobulin-like domain-containing protein [Ornithinibacillus sp. 4-3]|uniref:Immunoglobulin-like domain-containing protein n=1 Tax=Ornithinibacillus sp. 4-3 TaxID=3231488 RepID=A0AB39HR05_9BACI